MINRELILKTGKKTIEVEIKTLQDLHNSMDSEFVNAAEIIQSTKGRLVLSGVGKSALVAQKMVATFNSTGTPSIYMHAADAVHGDLGMITKDDVVICLSKSGETAEIKVLVPILRSFGNILIGLTASKDSYLGRQADVLLYTPVTMEADPNRLAPTASSIAQMAVGDALASVLLELKGFSHKHFARFHPGGSLGKQLYLRVADIYPNNEKPVVQLDSSIQDVILEMTSRRLGMTVVYDINEEICGIITDGDLRRMLRKHTDINELTAMDILSPEPKTIDPEALAVDAFRMMQKNSITQIIVARSKKYLGVVHIHDLIKEGIV